MAFEIDQDEDQKAAPLAAPPSAPPASGPPAPSTPAPAANSSGRFVGFDQLLQMNRPYAEQSAQNLTASNNAAFDQASTQLADATKGVQESATKGLSPDGMTYSGPTSTAGAFDAAQSSARAGMQQGDALKSMEGIQSLLENNGQDTDAARYNALFVNSVGQPQFQQAASKWDGFDQLVSQGRSEGQAAIDKSTGIQKKTEQDWKDAETFMANQAAQEDDIAGMIQTLSNLPGSARGRRISMAPDQMRAQIDAKYGPGAYDTYMQNPRGKP